MSPSIPIDLTIIPNRRILFLDMLEVKEFYGWWPGSAHDHGCLWSYPASEG